MTEVASAINSEAAVLQNVRTQNSVGLASATNFTTPHTSFAKAAAMARTGTCRSAHPFLLFRLIFGIPTQRARIGVNDAWDGVVIYVADFPAMISTQAMPSSRLCARASGRNDVAMR